MIDALVLKNTLRLCHGFLKNDLNKAQALSIIIQQYEAAKAVAPVSSYGGFPDAKAASGLGSKEQPSTKEQPDET